MEEKSKIFAKKNIYLILSAVAIVAIIVTIIVASANASKKQLSAKSSKSAPTTSSIYSNNNSTDKSTPSEPSTDPKTSEPDEPTTVQIVFDMPVAGGQIINDFTTASVTFNKTLGIYTGHLAVDFGGAEGLAVTACYDGVVSDITTSYLQGTTITIDHGNNLSTVYNSVEASETLAKGQTVKKGDKLGVISTNNRQEYKDGAHLHFEVLENGKKVSPYKYLGVEGK